MAATHLKLTFTLLIDVQHVSGKFVRKDELEEQLRHDLEFELPSLVEGADLTGLGHCGDSEYEVVGVEVS